MLKDWSKDIDLSTFLGAYYDDELIGFIKLLNAGKFMRTSGTIAKIKYRKKSPMNALIAKAVEICEMKNSAYLVYGKFVYGKKGPDGLSDFKRYNGFQKIDLPRYYIPLNIKGNIYLESNHI